MATLPDSPQTINRQQHYVIVPADENPPISGIMCYANGNIRTWRQEYDASLRCLDVNNCEAGTVPLGLCCGNIDVIYIIQCIKCYFQPSNHVRFVPWYDKDGKQC